MGKQSVMSFKEKNEISEDILKPFDNLQYQSLNLLYLIEYS